MLSPGLYQIRVTAAGYQAQEVQDIELTVAARIDLDFRLRPLNDVWEAGQYNSVFLPGSKTIVTFYGPDVDSTKTGSFEAQKGRSETLESTISEVIDRTELDELPLEGRDVYTMLVTQPGVTSDAGTARGLGLSINGTRPTSSNFMLDGLENNNYLTTGPLTLIAPEAVQEYRISTNNFSAEYGRTAGYVANAITRSGGDQYHGLVYFYLENDALNANSFQQNLIGAPRIPDKQIQPGYYVGGPILKNRLFFSSAFEHFSNHSFQGPQTLLLLLHQLLVLHYAEHRALQAPEYVPAARGYGRDQPVGASDGFAASASGPAIRHRAVGLHHAQRPRPHHGARHLREHVRTRFHLESLPGLHHAPD